MESKPNNDFFYQIIQGYLNNSTNTMEENSLFLTALSMIRTRYGAYLGQSENYKLLITYTVNDVPKLVKFCNDAEFTQIAKGVSQGAYDDNYIYIAFTQHSTTRSDSKGKLKPSIIFFNRDVMSHSTMIHELLHFVSHPNFVKATENNTPLKEGLTEYFTRKVQGQFSGKEDDIKQMASPMLLPGYRVLPSWKDKFIDADKKAKKQVDKFLNKQVGGFLDKRQAYENYHNLTSGQLQNSLIGLRNKAVSEGNNVIPFLETISTPGITDALKNLLKGENDVATALKNIRKKAFFDGNQDAITYLKAFLPDR